MRRAHALGPQASSRQLLRCALCKVASEGTCVSGLNLWVSTSGIPMKLCAGKRWVVVLVEVQVHMQMGVIQGGVTSGNAMTLPGVVLELAKLERAQGSGLRAQGSGSVHVVHAAPCQIANAHFHV